MKPERRAFTLIELMVVLALIVTLAGAAGLALQPGDRAIALQAGQTVLGQCLASVRAQAALSGHNAALAVAADPARPESSLRALAVAVRDPTVLAWRRVSPWHPLPDGIALLPATMPSYAAIEPGADWSGLMSSALPSGPVSVDSEASLLLEFTARGTVVGGGGNLVLTPYRRTPPGSTLSIVFVDPESVRGVSVSAYGVTQWIHERSGF